MVGETRTQQSSEDYLEKRVVEPKGSVSTGKGIRTQNRASRTQGIPAKALL